MNASPKDYGRVAERYLKAASNLCKDIPEASAFASYHALESIGCAWVRHVKQPVKPQHQKKLKDFVKYADYAFKRDASAAVILLRALRNPLLYPFPDGKGGYILPEHMMTAADALDALTKVDKVVTAVTKII